MQLRYSESDEKFRAELRAWLAEAVPAYGPAPLDRGEVDVVHARAGAHDQAQPRGGLEDGGGDLHAAAEDEDLAVADRTREHLGRGAEGAGHVVGGAQARLRAGIDAAREQDLHFHLRARPSYRRAAHRSVVKARGWRSRQGAVRTAIPTSSG